MAWDPQAFWVPVDWSAVRSTDARSWAIWLGSDAPTDSVISWLESGQRDSLSRTIGSPDGRKRLSEALKYWRTANRGPLLGVEDDASPRGDDDWTDTLWRTYRAEKDPFLRQRRAYQALRWGSFRQMAAGRTTWERQEKELLRIVRNGPDRRFRLRADALLGLNPMEVFDGLPAWKTTVVYNFLPKDDDAWQNLLARSTRQERTFLWLLTGLRSGDEVEAIRQIVSIDPTSPRTALLVFRALQKREPSARDWVSEDPDDSALASLARDALLRPSTPHRWIWHLALARLSADPEFGLHQILAAQAEKDLPPAASVQLQAEEASLRAHLVRSATDSHTLRLAELLAAPALRSGAPRSDADSWSWRDFGARWTGRVAANLFTAPYGNPLLFLALRSKVPSDPDSLVDLSSTLPSSTDPLVSWAWIRSGRDRNYWPAALSHAFFRTGDFARARAAWEPFRAIDSSELPYDPFDMPWPETRDGVPAPPHLTRVRLLDSLSHLQSLAARAGRGGAEAAFLLAVAAHRLTDFGDYPDAIRYVEHTTDTALLAFGLRHALRAESDLPSKEERALAAVLAARLERDLEWARGGCRVSDGYSSTWENCAEVSIANKAFERILRHHEKTATGKRFLKECSFYRGWREANAR